MLPKTKPRVNLNCVHNRCALPAFVHTGRKILWFHPSTTDQLLVATRTTFEQLQTSADTHRKPTQTQFVRSLARTAIEPSDDGVDSDGGTSFNYDPHATEAAENGESVRNVQTNQEPPSQPNPRRAVRQVPLRWNVCFSGQPNAVPAATQGRSVADAAATRCLCIPCDAMLIGYI